MTDMIKKDSKSRIAEALSLLGQTTQKQTVAQKAEAEIVDRKAEATARAANNQIARIWNDAHLSNQQKVEATVAYLTCDEKGDYATARARFNEFKQFYAMEQQNSVEADIASMEALIEEVKNATRPMVDGIVRDLDKVQQAVEVTSKLLGVIRKARLDGKTIEAIGEAFRRNEKLVRDINTLEESRPLAENRKRAAEGRLDQALEADQESRKGLFKGIVRSVAGPKAEIVSEIETAKERLAQAEQTLQQIADNLEKAQQLRRTELEDGPLTILRSIDATTDSFSANLVNQADGGIKLLRNIASSIGSLASRTDTGEADVRGLVKKTADIAARDELLQGALKKAAEKTHDQAEDYSARLAAKDEAIAKESDQVQLAILKSDRSTDLEKRDGALDYEEALQNSVNAFASIMSNNTDSRSRATQGLALIHAQKALFERLANEALPATSTALYTVLTEARALQIGEEGMAVSAVTESARKLGQHGLESILETQREMHKAGVDSTEATIKALEAAHEAIASQIVQAVEDGVENRKLGDRLQKVAGELRDTTETFAQVRATIADMTDRKGPDAANQNAEPANVTVKGAQPSRPAGGGLSGDSKAVFAPMVA